MPKHVREAAPPTHSELDVVHAMYRATLGTHLKIIQMYLSYNSDDTPKDNLHVQSNSGDTPKDNINVLELQL